MSQDLEKQINQLNENEEVYLRRGRNSLTNPFKAAKIIDIVFFSALFIFSLFAPFDLKGKIIFSTFILIGGIVALKITKIIELVLKKIKQHNEK